MLWFDENGNKLERVQIVTRNEAQVLSIISNRKISHKVVKHLNGGFFILEVTGKRNSVKSVLRSLERSDLLTAVFVQTSALYDVLSGNV